MNIIRFVRDDGEILELTENWGIYDLEGLSYPDVSFDTEPYAFYDGSYFTKSHAEKRVISFKAVNMDHDDHFLVRDKVGQFFNHLAEYELYIYFMEKDAYIKGKVTDFQMPLRRSDSRVEFDMEFTSVNPFLQSASDFGRNLNEVENKRYYPWHYLIDEKKPSSVRIFSQNPKLVNNGVVDTGFVATVIFAEATTSFCLQNQDGEKVDISRSFAVGDVLQIDTENKVARINGQKFYKGISNDSDFFALSPGENILSYTAQAGESTLDISIYYRSQRLVF